MRVTEIRASALLPAEDSFAIGRAASLLEIGDYLVVGDRRGDPRLIVFDLSRGVPIQRLGRAGSGPGEIADPTTLRRRFGRDDTLQLFDTGLRRLAIYSVGPAGLRFERHEAVPDGILLLDVLPLRNAVAFTGIFNDAGIYIAARVGDTITSTYRRIGRPPFHVAEGRIALESRSVATIDPAGENLAIGFIARSQLQFHRTDGSSSIDVSDTVALKIPVRGPRDLAIHVVGLAATHDRVFVLFCGCRGGLPREVLVYDWSGRLLRVLALDHEVYSMTVSEDGRRLYGGIEDPAPAIGVWDLPQL